MGVLGLGILLVYAGSRALSSRSGVQPDPGLPSGTGAREGGGAGAGTGAGAGAGAGVGGGAGAGGGGGAGAGAGRGSLATTDVAGFRTALDRSLKERSQVLIIFSAGPVPEKSWCPVCRLVVPPAQHLSEQIGYSVLRVNVGDRPTWKDPEHPFRTAPDLQLHYVPTLLWAAADGSFGPALGSVEKCAAAPEGRRACVRGLLEEFLLLRS